MQHNQSGPETEKKHNPKKPRLERGQTEPGLVVFYEIRLGNGAGLFLQPGATCTARAPEPTQACSAITLHIHTNATVHTAPQFAKYLHSSLNYVV